MSLKIGLTGSIGMGKSTTAQMFVAEGCALWDADAAVHRLYHKGGAAVSPIRVAFPNAIKEGAVDREVLREQIQRDPAVLKLIEDIVHPLVAADRARFIEESDAEYLVLDIPLLFETGVDRMMDATVCVSVSDEVQEKRVLARGTMSREQFLAIRGKQMSNAEKSARADYVVETDSLEHAKSQVQAIMADIRGKRADA